MFRKSIESTTRQLRNDEDSGIPVREFEFAIETRHREKSFAKSNGTVSRRRRSLDRVGADIGAKRSQRSLERLRNSDQNSKGESTGGYTT